MKIEETAEGSPAVITAQTRRIEISARLAGAPDRPLRQPLRIEKSVGLQPGYRLHGELVDLPIALPVTAVAPETWVLEIPANVLSLLVKDRGKAVYQGKLLTDDGAQPLSKTRWEVPIRLELTRAGATETGETGAATKKPRRARKKAAPREPIRSAG